MFIQSFIPQVQTSRATAFIPRNAFAFAQATAPQPQTQDGLELSEAARLAGLRTGPENLALFGGDRKTAIGTLIASGAKAENPKLGFFQDVMRKLVGGTKTSTKKISAEQSISTKVNVENFRLKGLRLTTKGPTVGEEQTVRHIDFALKTPTGKKAQVKDVGTLIGKGQPTRMIEQNIKPAGKDEQGVVTNSYFDPKTGQKFLQTTEIADRLSKDKMGLVKSHKNKDTYREIDVLGTDGKADKRYVFDYGAKCIRLEQLGDDGQVTSVQSLPRKTDYFKLVQQLSMAPPSQQAPPAA